MAPSGERCLTGPCPGLNTGQGPVRGQGRGGKKKKPGPGPLSGAGREKRRGPGGPVTNSSQSLDPWSHVHLVRDLLGYIWCSFLCYTVAIRDLLCKGYDILYGFLGYTDMRLILGYESGGKGCARISFYIRELGPLFFFHASHPLHLQSLKLQLHVVQCTIPPRPLTPPAFQALRP